MEPDSSLQIVAIVVLVLLSAFFSSAETALTTVNKHRLRSLAEDGNRNAQNVLKLIENPAKMLSAILIGNNIVNISASALVTTFTTNVFGSKFVGVSTGVLTLVILLFGEITPKSLATLYNEKIALLYIHVVAPLVTLLTPVIWFVDKLSGVIFWVLRVDRDAANNQMTEGELRTIVDVSVEDGVLEKEEKSMINNVVDFGDSKAKDVMVPRADMALVSVDATFDEVFEIFNEEHYSRLPVYDENKDTVIGIVYLKDLFFFQNQADKKNTAFSIRNIMREPFFVYEYQKTSSIMAEMRNRFVSLAIVLDEYATAVGLITIEDLIEEIVGEIRDEFDMDELKMITKLSDNHYEIDAAMKLSDLEDSIGISLESEDYDSLGGYVIELLDHLPNVGETVKKDGITFQVVSMEKNRIDRIAVTIDPELQG
ncbi:MAG: hemolysin family protein [Lachnospiraceae bacterium]|nr:hemolysin family protein [Lachnospiraceae bacterium]HCJ07182.1 hemolysin [Lachnospiraceae bacterium]